MAGRKRTLVWIMISLPPYRASVCLRTQRELPDLDVIAAITHHPLEGDRWPPVPADLLRQVVFAPDQIARPMSPRDHFRDLGKALRVVRWLHNVRPDAVVVHGYNDATRLMSIAWCKASGTPVLVAGDSNIKADHARGLRKLIKSAYLHALLRCVDAVLPFGTLGERYFGRYGVPASRIFKYPAEPNYDMIAGQGRPRCLQIVERLNLPRQRRRLLYSGRLAPEKRVDLLVAAFGRIAADRPDWDLLVLGSGPERDRLTSLVPASLKSRVQFVPAIQDPADVFALYHASDVLVLPSSHEPWALVVNEAAAAGLALVCSDVVGAAADLVREGVNGLTFRTGDVADLVGALIDVTDPNHLERYKAASAVVIAHWRAAADPVAGLAAALQFVGVLPQVGPLAAGQRPARVVGAGDAQVVDLRLRGRAGR